MLERVPLADRIGLCKPQSSPDHNRSSVRMGTEERNEVNLGVIKFTGPVRGGFWSEYSPLVNLVMWIVHIHSSHTTSNAHNCPGRSPNISTRPILQIISSEYKKFSEITDTERSSESLFTDKLSTVELKILLRRVHALYYNKWLTDDDFIGDM